MIKLFIPQQACECLSLYIFLVVRDIGWNYSLIKLISFLFSCFKYLLKLFWKWFSCFTICQPQVNFFCMLSFYIIIIDGRNFSSIFFLSEFFAILPVNNSIVKYILYKFSFILSIKNPFKICFI